MQIYGAHLPLTWTKGLLGKQKTMRKKHITYAYVKATPVQGETVLFLFYHSLVVETFEPTIHLGYV